MSGTDLPCPAARQQSAMGATLFPLSHGEMTADVLRPGLAVGVCVCVCEGVEWGRGYRQNLIDKRSIGCISWHRMTSLASSACSRIVFLVKEIAQSLFCYPEYWKSSFFPFPAGCSDSRVKKKLKKPFRRGKRNWRSLSIQLSLTVKRKTSLYLLILNSISTEFINA